MDKRVEKEHTTREMYCVRESMNTRQVVAAKPRTHTNQDSAKRLEERLESHRRRG